MTLLERSIQSGGLLRHQEREWTRTRTTTTGADAGTGAPITNEATSTIRGYHQWLTSIERQDFKGDPAAALLTIPGLLQAGDHLHNPTLGSFLVLEEGPQPHGPFDRAPLRRA